ncbi:MAG: glycine cleavage system protein GcvH [Deltaproteobacteria bacterium]|nr:glycine cleavage system protein GcvH [Deltaproteobacteria bacterium]MBK8717822.1 glycine cleavage system protein GcvH [Deltaproteobacteria bacterium]MBP7287816.1 glycine cleavage system protein GcvH [Nannocystaceae bacterium]
MSQDVPANLRYTKEHEWARRDGDVIVVGITAHAVEQLGDITLVTLPSIGTKVGAGDRFGDVDSVKAVSELYAPLAGEIVAKNADLDATPERVNEDPYGAGWMIKIKPADAAAFDGLLDADAYGKLL